VPNAFNNNPGRGQPVLGFDAQQRQSAANVSASILGPVLMDQFQFLNLTTKPLIPDAEKAGWLYGEWSREDVLLLCRRGHLPALANPPPGAQRFFLTKTLLSLADDEKWVKKAILILRENIATKNQVAKVKRGARNGDGAHADGGQESAPRRNRQSAEGGLPIFSSSWRATHPRLNTMGGVIPHGAVSGKTHE